jgi:3-methylfumaryl-CoA hydratase
MTDWQDWIGRSVMASDVATPGLAMRYRATLDLGADAPLLGLGWCLCLPDAATATLGPDGHPPRGDFLPPVPLPRRMWAASELVLHHGIAPGMAVSRTSRIAAVREKQGATGALLFVEVAHALHADNRLVQEETQTLVFRAPADAPADSAAPASPPSAPPPARDDWPHRRTITPGPALLFRYSALTFNSHRIHYDLPYARAVEGYAGLVVHGPLVATLLLHLAQDVLGDRPVGRFGFRALAPAFADRPLTLCAREDADGLALAAFDDRGAQTVTAHAAAR